MARSIEYYDVVCCVVDDALLDVLLTLKNEDTDIKILRSYQEQGHRMFVIEVRHYHKD